MRKKTTTRGAVARGKRTSNNQSGQNVAVNIKHPSVRGSVNGVAGVEVGTAASSSPSAYLISSSWTRTLVGLAVASVLIDAIVLSQDPIIEEVGHSNCTRPMFMVLLALWMWSIVLGVLGNGGIDIEHIFGGNSALRVKMSRRNMCLVVASVGTILYVSFHFVTTSVVFGPEEQYREHMDMWHLSALLFFIVVILLCICAACVVLFKEGIDRSLSFGGSLSRDAAAVVQTAFRVALSPFYTVTFAQVLVGDWLTSFAKLFGDVSICLCVALTGHMHLPSLLSSGDEDELPSADDISDIISTRCLVSVLTPIIVSLPFIWRFLQCARCYVETLHIRHAANAIKYCTGIAVVFSSTYRRWGDESGLFWFCVAVNSLYSFWWDVHMDWGMFVKRGSSSADQGRFPCMPVIRKGTLFGGSTSVYVVAAVLDFILRISWSMKLSSSYGTLFDGEYSSMLGQFLELVRRSMWTCIRVEWEHISTKSKAKYAPVLQHESRRGDDRAASNSRNFPKPRRRSNSDLASDESGTAL